MNFIELMRQLLLGNEFGQEPVITTTEKETFRIIRRQEDALAELLNPVASKYIVLADVAIRNIVVNRPLNYDTWIFVKDVEIDKVVFKNDVTFSNCFFLKELNIYNSTFSLNIKMEFTSIATFKCYENHFNGSDVYFIKIDISKKLEIKHCVFNSYFLFEPRRGAILTRAGVNPTQTYPVFNFSDTKFNESVFFNWFHASGLLFKLVLCGTKFLDELAFGFEYFEQHNFEQLIYERDYYIDFVSDTTMDRLPDDADDFPENKSKVNHYSTIKQSFDTLIKYYNNTSDSDNVLELSYYFRKFEAKQHMYQDTTQFNYEIKNLKYYISYFFMDLSFRYFTSWKRVLTSMSCVFGIFFMIYTIYADKLVNSQGHLIYKRFCLDPMLDFDLDRLTDAFYFSLVTFTTIGYGDLNPTGFLKIVAGLEGLFGVLLVSIFTVTLARKILR